MKIQIAVLLIFNFSRAVFANPIEAYDEKVLAAHDELLKSVVGVIFSHSEGELMCTATLIDSNILLTARHCTNGVKEGADFNIRHSRDYKVVKILEGDQAYVEHNTDMALVLFEATKYKNSELKELPLFPLSFLPWSADGDRVLLVGAGSVDRDDDNFLGIFHAGYNHLIPKEKFEGMKPRLRELNMLNDSIFLEADRDERLVYKVDFKLEKPISLFESKVLSRQESAIPLPGDSGGPLIAFDIDGKAHLIGVATHSHPGYTGNRYTFSMRDSLNQDALFSLKAPQVIDEVKFLGSNAVQSQDEYLHAQYDMVMACEKQIDDWLLSRSRGVFYREKRTERTAVAKYASVTSVLNEPFLKKGLSELTALRTQKKIKLIGKAHE